MPNTLDQRLRSKYGIDNEERIKMILDQGGKCGICGRDGRKLVVDHDHETGVVRGMLCYGCNVALGSFMDGALFASAKKWLRRGRKP